MTYNIPSDPGPDFPQTLRMVVEIPKGSSNKYEYDFDLGLFKLSRTLYSPMQYPGDYGFVPGTIAEDNDPYDVLSMMTAPSYPGIVYMVRPIGVLDMLDEDEPDHKIVAVPDRDPRYSNIRAIEDLGPHTRREIEHFFSIYKELEEKVTVMQGWRTRDDAFDALNESRSRYLNKARAATPTPA